MLTSPGAFPVIDVAPAVAAPARGEFPGPAPGIMSCRNTGGGKNGSAVHLEKKGRKGRGEREEKKGIEKRRMSKLCKGEQGKKI